MKKIIAISVSLLAASLFFAQTADSATLVSSLAPQQTRRVRILLTAYVPDEGTKTATGRNANLPGIAADFKLVPAGTTVVIPGKGSFVVDDTGGQLRKDARNKGICHLDLRILPAYRTDDRIDAFNKAHRRAMAIGKSWVDVYIVSPEKNGSQS